MNKGKLTLADQILVKRVYDPPDRADGYRVLVDSLWPRGLTKAAAAIDLWLKEIAPSNELRKWYGHDPKKWEGFKERYFKELDRDPAPAERLREKARQGKVTLLFSSRELDLNNARALKEYLARRSEP